MGGNIPGGNFLGGNFPGESFQGERFLKIHLDSPLTFLFYIS